MPYRPDDYLGPAAPWMKGDEDAYVYEYVRTEVSNFLAARLRARLAAIEDENAPLDVFIMELRRQIAACAVDGDVGTTSEMSDMVWDLVQARENTRRL